MTLNGFYAGNNPADFATAQQWLGGSVDLISARSGKASWADWRGSLGWEIGNVSGVSAAKAWNIPLFPVQGNLHDGATGKYDADYVAFAKQLVAAYGTTQPILVRTGEEFNGNWFGWSAAKNPQDYIANYQHFVDAFRSVSGNFKFEWNVGAGGSMDPATAYPGDKYVDYVGMDFYWDTKQSWSVKDPVQAFNIIKSQQYGLQWLENFAAEHGKQSAYSEWGFNSSDAAPFVQLVKDWFSSHNTGYQLYWDSDADFAGRVDGNRYGVASELFKQVFGTSQPSGGTSMVAGDADTVLAGGSTADRIVVGSGNNYLQGGTSGDLIVAGDGNNHIWGGTLAGGDDGNDTIIAGGGTNAINGNAGDDIITVGLPGSTGANRVLGGQGNDLITVQGAGANSVNGNLGDDVIHAETATGSNLLRGGQGNDHIFGGAGTDMLMGDAGDDVLIVSGASGHQSVLSGGSGADLFRFDAIGAGTMANQQLQEITDFTPGTDHIALPFAVVGGGLLQTAGTTYANASQAMDAARLLLAGQPGHDVAALQVGSDTVLFYSQSGTNGQVDGVIQLDHVAASALGAHDFATVG